MKRVLWTVVILVSLLGAATCTQAVPRPSWDWTAIEGVTTPVRPSAYEDEMRKAYSVTALGEADPPFHPWSKATMWAPAVCRAWLFRYADNNLLTEDQFADRWTKEKAVLAKTLKFQLYLIAKDYEHALISGSLSRIVNVVLVDDKGRRFAPVNKYSGDPTAQWIADQLWENAYNTVDFPLLDKDGKPIVTDSTEYVDVYVTCAEGKVRFHFPFDE